MLMVGVFEDVYNDGERMYTHGRFQRVMPRLHKIIKCVYQQVDRLPSHDSGYEEYIRLRI